jgi:hypothetical protein
MEISDNMTPLFDEGHAVLAQHLGTSNGDVEYDLD